MTPIPAGWWHALGSDVEVTRVDGVLTLRGAGRPGLVQGGLMFRVGPVDEPVPHRGITSIVDVATRLREDVFASSFLGTGRATTVTGFEARGSTGRFVATLDQVALDLARLPQDAICGARGILQRDDERRHASLDEDLLVCRYGWSTWGLPATPEFGCRYASDEDVLAWTQGWFTRENAVLWLLADEVPTGIRLPLPDGARRPTPTPSNYLATAPAGLARPDPLLIQAPVDRSSAAEIYGRVLEDSLRRALAQERRTSPFVEVKVEVLDGAAVLVSVHVDTGKPHLQALALEVVRTLSEEPVSEMVLARAREPLRRRLEGPQGTVIALRDTAFDVLVDAQPRSLETMRADIAAVTVGEVRRVAESVLSHALVQADTATLRDTVLAGSPRHPARADNGGPRVQARDGSGDSLTFGSAGIYLDERDRVLTPVFVRYDDVVLCQDFGHRGLTIHGRDGSAIVIDPARFALTQSQHDALLSKVPAQAVMREHLAMHSRQGQATVAPHQPAPTEVPPSRRRPTRATSGGAGSSLWRLLLLALFAIGILAALVNLFR